MANGGGLHSSAETSGWEIVAPADAGFSPGLEASFAKLLAAGQLANVHGVVALRHGRIVFERYMAGTDCTARSKPAPCHA